MIHPFRGLPLQSLPKTARLFTVLHGMAVRYEDPDLDLELTEDIRDQGDKDPLHGVASTLLRWHEQDPPDDAERLRNDRVEELQGNRNPFVDRPEWVGFIWESDRE